MFKDANEKLKYLWFAFGFGVLYLIVQPVTFTPSNALALVFVFLWSLILSIKTAKENYGHDTPIYRVMVSWGERWSAWYDGGNSVYDPAYPWTMDMWHLMRDLMVYAFAGAMVAVTGTTFWLIIPLIENLVFQTKSTLFHYGTFPVWELITEFFKTRNKFTNT